MKKVFKTGVVAFAVVGLSLVGFGQAFGYGGGGSSGPANFIGNGLVIVGGNAPVSQPAQSAQPAPSPVVSVAPSAPARVLGVKVTRVDDLIASTKYRDRNDNVKALQAELKTLGFFPQRVPTTGFYGKITRAAVNKYLASVK